MSKTLINSPNSFVTFYNLNNPPENSGYLTDTSCGIQKDFCYPIYDENDLAFQFNIASDEELTSSNIVVNRDTGSGAEQVASVTIQVNDFGIYNGSTPIYNIYLNFSGSELTANLNDGDCFTITIAAGTIEEELIYLISNQCFKKIDDTCLTTRLKYVNTSNAFGFNYFSYGTFPLIAVNNNVLRLPFYLKNPQNIPNNEVYVRSNGVRKLLSSRISKKYKAYIDEVPEQVHQDLVIALSHDGVFFKTEEFDEMQVVFENEYNDNWPEIMQNVNIWSADFSIFVTPFNNYNSNCG